MKYIFFIILFSTALTIQAQDTIAVHEPVSGVSGNWMTETGSGQSFQIPTGKTCFDKIYFRLFNFNSNRNNVEFYIYQGEGFSGSVEYGPQIINTVGGWNEVLLDYGINCISGEIYTYEIRMTDGVGYFYTQNTASNTFALGKSYRDGIVLGTGQYDNCFKVLCTGEVPLPVELISFEASIGEYNNVNIYWETATEITNDFFTLERSNDCSNWELIAEIDGAGNSNQLLAYKYCDDNPHKGINYYRLKQTDFDGKYEYFEPIQINIQKNSVLEVSLFPNPASEYIIVCGNKEDIENLKIFTIEGKEVTNSVSFKNEAESLIRLDVSSLNNGLYILKSQKLAFHVLIQ